MKTELKYHIKFSELYPHFVLSPTLCFFVYTQETQELKKNHSDSTPRNVRQKTGKKAIYL